MNTIESYPLFFFDNFLFTIYIKWGSFQYTVSNGITESNPATITLVSPKGTLIGSDFMLNSERWTVTGNKATIAPAIFEPYSRGLLLNRYIFGSDDLINIDQKTQIDQSLWYFEAPNSFLGNQGIAYKGALKFTLGAFSGNFTLTETYKNVS